MKVGDLVTLSAAGMKTDKVIDQHKRYFRSVNSDYYNFCSEDRKRWSDYWEGEKSLGLIVEVLKQPIHGYDWDIGGYTVTGEKIMYQVAWQANPKSMIAERHTRSHLKFAKRSDRRKK